MKKIFYLFLVIQYFSHASFAQTNGWYSINHGETYGRANLYFVNPLTGFVGSGPGPSTSYITSNGGNNWSVLPVILGSISFINSSTGYSANGNSLYKTTNTGINWTLINSYTGLVSNSIFFINENTGFSARTVYTGDGYPLISKTTDGGLNWAASQPHYPPTLISLTSISFADANNGIAVGFDGQPETRLNTMYSTTNGGISWTNNIFFPGSYDHYGYAQFKFVDSLNGYYSNYTFIEKTTNKGASFSPVQAVIQCISVYFPGALTGFAIGGPSVIFKTTDGAASWTGQDTLSTSEYNSEVFFANMQTGYVVGDYGLILKTTTGGYYYSVSGQVHYQDNNQPVTSGYVKAVHYDSVTSVISTLDSAQIQSNGSYMMSRMPQHISFDIMAFENDEAQLNFVPTYYPSTTNWQNATTLSIDTSLTNINVLVYRISNPGGPLHIAGHITKLSQNPYVGLNGAIVYAKLGNLYQAYSISDNNGAYKVDSLSAGTYNIIVDHMGFSELTRSVILTNYSKDTIDFIMSANPIGIESQGQMIPELYWLGSNYPNPFNPETKIEFGLPNSSKVVLTIYDILGREVTKLVNEELKAGVYVVNWNASSYASGIYFYKLESGDPSTGSGRSFVQTKKMVLVK